MDSRLRGNDKGKHGMTMEDIAITQGIKIKVLTAAPSSLNRPTTFTLMATQAIKSLSIAHNPHSITITLIVVVIVPVIEVHVPRVTRIIGVRRTRPEIR